MNAVEGKFKEKSFNMLKLTQLPPIFFFGVPLIDMIFDSSYLTYLLKLDLFLCASQYGSSLKSLM